MDGTQQDDRNVNVSPVDAWKQEILDIRCGWEWAFANGARRDDRSSDPALQAVLEREAELHELIRTYDINDQRN